ncbi:MAG: hypothetical protein KGJ59_07295, partial [Bacteroidota bacterium]|nr:hypothetical protein [Bacteroidota bacterium]
MVGYTSFSLVPPKLVKLFKRYACNAANYIFIALLFLLLFSGTDCRKPPPVVPPDNGPDTTSHNFSFQTFSLGDGNSSALYDCQIINDTLVYAVGEIYLKDSTGSYDLHIPYNFAVWNGKGWDLRKVPYNYQGQLFYHPIQTVFALNANDVWFGGNGLEHWDGKQFSNVDAVNPFWSGRLMRKIWASSDNDIYIVGDEGTIVHYTNGSWQKINSGTTANIFDVWGITANGQTTVYVPVSDVFGTSGVKKILRIQGNTVDSLEWNTGRNVFSVWTPDGSTFYAVGNGVF